MSNAVAGTDWVLPNEPCYLIYEINKPAPDSRSLRRYRYILVGRNDQIAEYVEDLGLAKDFAGATELQVKTGGMEQGRAWSEHTVAEAVGIIEEARYPRFDTQDVPRLFEDRKELETAYEMLQDQRKRKGPQFKGA